MSKFFDYIAIAVGIAILVIVAAAVFVGPLILWKAYLGPVWGAAAPGWVFVKFGAGILIWLAALCGVAAWVVERWDLYEYLPGPPPIKPLPPSPPPWPPDDDNNRSARR